MLHGHEVKHSTTDWYAIVEAMPATVKRAAALKRDQPVKIKSESENSCPGHEADYTTPGEEEIDVYRFQTYPNHRELDGNAEFLQMQLD
jgi:hypothetical protein